MIETVILGITSFIGTNIDDILLNTLFFSEAKTKADHRNIVIGKYIGIGVLILFSVLGACGLQFLPQHYIGYLGLLPIALGIKEITAAIKAQKANKATDTTEKSSNKMLNAALITMANGADNIGVYVPLFAGFAVWQTVFTVLLFLVLIAVWCFLGKVLANLPVLRNFLAKYKTIIVPAVYIVLGIYLLMKNFL